MFEAELTLEEVKRRLVLDMFPSEEDGNPDNYSISLGVDEKTSQPIIILQEKIGLCIT